MCHDVLNGKHWTQLDMVPCDANISFAPWWLAGCTCAMLSPKLGFVSGFTLTAHDYLTPLSALNCHNANPS